MCDPTQQLDSNNNSDFICGVVEGFYGKPWTFDQRHDLFKRLKDMKLNSFMYAPKDDTKHRAKWRTLYTDEEAKKMRSLIEDAKLNGIDFYYSLAPGLDMVYSDQEEIDCLISKYDQLVEMGCQCFAILFDDIEPTITNDKDGQVFKNYASAQVSVTNLIFEHLNKPKFLFCPTEYCESRAVPNVSDSFYLNTIGSGLHEGIDIMWSGSRVISRFITNESIDQLVRVIRRAPVIWENLHANDYDKRRIFMGPYSGRTTGIISKLKGVLTNPNCEYEANYIAMHTLAQWSKSKNDINENNRCDIKRGSCLEVLLDFQEDDESYDKTVYDPHRALALAIKSWYPRVLEDRPYLGDMTEYVINHQKWAKYEFFKRGFLPSAELEKERSSIQHSNNMNDDDTNSNNVEMISDDTTQSSEASCGSRKSQMDTTSCANISANIVDYGNNSDSCEMQDTNPIRRYDAYDQQAALDLSKTACPCKTQNTPTALAKNLEEKFRLDELPPAVSLSDLSLLVELFYLPFEHGSLGTNLLNDLKWLRNNCDVIMKSEAIDSDNISKRRISNNGRATATTLGVEGEIQSVNDDDDSSTDSADSVDSKKPDVWRSRAEKLNILCNSIKRLVDTMIYKCPNKRLLLDLYTYLIDLRQSMDLLSEYLKFLRCRSSDQGSCIGETHNRFRLGRENNTAPPNPDEDELEPWVHRGGIMEDIYKIIHI